MTNQPGETTPIAPSIFWVETDFIDDDIKAMFRKRGVYMDNDLLIAQHIKLLRQVLGQTIINN